MNDSSYSLEDILLELELKHDMEEKRPKPPKSATEKFAKAPTAPSDTESVPKLASKVTPVPKSAAKDTAVPQTTRAVAVPTKPTVTQHTVQVNTRTRVLTVESAEDRSNTLELRGSDQMEGQLMMADFVKTAEEEEIEHELRRRRRVKVDAFRLADREKESFKLMGDEEETDETQETLAIDNDEEELADFNDYDEAESIQSELNYRRRTSAMGVIASGVMTALLIALTLLYEYGWFHTVPAAIVNAVHTVILIGVLFVNHRLVAHGIKGFVTFRSDADTAPALCGVIGLVYTAAQFFYLPIIAEGKALFLSAVAAIGLMGGALGRQMQIMRICRNFTFISGERHRKLAAHYLDDNKIAAEMGQTADEDGFPSTLFYRRADFLENFLQNSYASDPADRTARWYVWVAFAVSVLCAAGFGLLFPAQATLSPIVFAVTALLCLPSFMMFSTQRAMTRSCKRALKQNVFIAGWDAVEAFGERTDMVVVEAQELFPKGCVKLHGIKTFSGTRIDDAITDAAAVAIAAGGPLAPIFRYLIEQRVDILGDVDSLAYEQDMGVSGWVSGRRTLIGNRRLMENHGITLPTKEYEARYIKDDRTIVYLSTGGELSAMFVVSYLAHPDIRAQLKALCKGHTRLLIRTCDPNVTAARVAAVMGVEEHSIQVLTAGQGRAYGRALEPADDRVNAQLACGGRAQSKLYGVVQCRRLRRGGTAAVWSQLIPSVAAMVFSVFVTVVSGMIPNAPMMLGFMLVCGALAWGVPKCFRT